MTATASTTYLIAAGGTGGGIYPALTTAEALQRREPHAALHFVGAVGGMEERIVPRQQFAGYHALRGGPLHGVSLPRRLLSLVAIAFGILQGWRLVGRLRPAALFLTGGWASFAPAVACWLRRVPIVIYMPDIEPALVIRVISRFARLILTPVPESAAYFAHLPKRVRVESVGYPLRQSLLRATREAGIAHFRLDPARRTLLIWGGSLGARRINETTGAILPDLIAAGVQVIHVSGERDWEVVRTRWEFLPEAVRAHVQVFPYLKDDAGLAMAAADLTVSRAGASTLGEYPHFGLAAILVPLAFAWRYQQVNADWLAARGAAIRLDDERLAAELLPTLRALLDDSERLREMSKAARALAGANAAERIAERIAEEGAKGRH
ncbi:MAG TPA: UDP-N-acetylglucosamine--N-acetylmuramyl-(pentapeptide) pyrophosphoryl-undecaprenol N-acetylglucosamine transferase [Aggregatilineales bacterium]|nr:UDP-N-acetylglucosamine--N-acetylmuramyl-(pentapeptide) pyrophosphoryl-undecaprenol N-acetylglucosamine transferase [Aggregatilineales bacterium]